MPIMSARMPVASDDIMRERDEAIREIEMEILNGLVMRSRTDAIEERHELDETLEALRAKRTEITDQAPPRILDSEEYEAALGKMRAAIAQMREVAARMRTVIGYLDNAAEFLDAARKVKAAINAIA